MLERAAATPTKVVLRFVEPEAAVRSLTYGTLARGAQAIAAQLQRSCRPGERALLIYPAGLEFSSAFFGCALSHVVAVPAPPPDPARPGRTLPRLEMMALDAEPTVVLTDEPTRQSLAALLSPNHALFKARWISTDLLSVEEEKRDEEADAWQELPCDPDTLLLLQYTSGSTAAPKGVMITHGNALDNSEYLRRAWGYSTESVSVMWVPNFHDDGVIHGLLQPIYTGFPTVLMSPQAVIQKPLRWLQAISKYAATHAGGPNFIYALAAARIAPEDCSGLDLSNWSMAYNAAEPVRRRTLHAFYHRFRDFGFRWDAFYPAFGLAEATLIVSTRRRGEKPVFCRVEAKALEHGAIVEVAEDDDVAENDDVAQDHPASRLLTSCGPPICDVRIRIVDPKSGQRQPAGKVGEVWIAGAAVAQGYWRRPEATAATFDAWLDDGGDGPYLRTGDLGFLRRGDLFLTGRLKDLIIIHGRNHYPQDLELTMERVHPAFRPGCGAAFSVETAGEERLVLVQEIRPALWRDGDEDEVFQQIQRTVLEEHGLGVYAMVLLPPGEILKTSSGKVQRSACREGFSRGRLKMVAKWAEDGSVSPPESSEGISPPQVQMLLEQLLRIAQPLLRRPPTPAEAEAPLASFGLDSLILAQFLEQVHATFGILIPPRQLFEDTPSLAALASWLGAQDLGPAPSVPPAPLSPPTSRGRSRRAQLPLDTAELPLTAAQEQLFYLAKLEPAAVTAYTETLSLALRGPLQRERLRQALQILVERHEALRTVIEEDGSRQRVLPAMEVVLPVVDCSGASSSAQRERQTKWLKTSRPMDLTRGPLCRFHLLEVGASHHLLVIDFHHIIADGLSANLVVEELCLLYADNAALLPEATPLSVFIAHQSNDRESAPYQEDATFWRRRFPIPQPDLDLLADHRRPPSFSFRGGHCTTDLSPELSQQIERLSAAAGCTPFMTLLAAYALLLHRLTGQPEVLLGYSVSGRPAAAQRLVGFCTHLLPFSTRLAPGLSFAAYLSGVRHQLLDELDHQSYSLPHLVQDLKLEPNPSRGSVVPAVFNLNPLREPPEMTGLEVHQEWFPNGHAKYDLTLDVLKKGEGWCLRFDYAADLFEETTIRRLAACAVQLLSAIVQDSDQVVVSLPLHSTAAQRELIYSRNPAPTPFPHQATVHDLFKEQVDLAPDAIALRFGALQLTRAGLEGRANQIAARLQDLGAGPGSKLAFLTTAGLDRIAALLAILKVGAAYVPLDSGDPVARTLGVLADTGCTLLLTTGKTPGLEHIETLPLDSFDPPNLAAPRRPQPPISSDHPAYVMYTSGSTGEPKGVVVTHRNIVRLVRDNPFFTVSGEDTFVQASSIAFDAATFEIWSSLLGGAALLLVPDRDLIALAGQLQKHRVTMLWLTAQLFHLMVDEHPEALANVRHLLAGGEALSVPHVEKFLTLHPSCRLTNGYGPTEGTTFTCCCDLSHHGVGTRSAAIGRPIANGRALLLDPFFNLVPDGFPGELYLGGLGLATAYLGLPALTAQRFVGDPWSAQPGERLYRTGDLARYRGDGQLEFLGRVDQQVKMRGFRVEPGEIEAILTRHPGVHKAAVLPHGAGDALRLIAYVEATAADHVGWEAHLHTHLPTYMVPSDFVFLTHLPLNRNGKVDHHALVALTPPEERQTLPQAPRNPIEEMLVSLWAEFLDLPVVGIHDHFFHHGGHSISATRLLARVRSTFNNELALKELFRCPTPALLAEHLAESRRPGENLPPILSPVPRTTPPVVSFAQQRLWFLDQLKPGCPQYNMAALLELPTPVVKPALETALRLLIKRHEALRTHFAVRHGQPVQRIAETVDFHLPEIDLSALVDGDALARRLARSEARRPFRLEQGPLFRGLLVKRSPGCHELWINLHHAIADGWSLGILGRELLALYSALAHGQTLPELPALALQYADYAVGQRQWLQGELLERQLAWWRQLLGDGPRFLALPTDRPRPLLQRFSGAVANAALPAAGVAELENLARGQNVTLYMAFLGGFFALLRHTTQQRDLVVGTPVANREHAETGGIFGCFVNVLPLRLALGHLSVERLLEQVRQLTLDAWTQQDVPFEMLVDDLELERDLSRNPLYQVLFDFHPDFSADGALEGFQPIATDTAICDLSLSILGGQGGCQLRAEYSTDLFEATTIQRFLRHYINLLAAMAATPTARVHELPILSAGERHQLLVAWGEAKHLTAAPRPLAQLFTEQADRTPDTAALADDEASLSYRQLDRLSDRLGRLLRQRGIGHEALVGVCIPRSAEMVIALLGIAKAGGAWLPLDPSHPQERTAALLREADAAAVVVCGLDRPIPAPTICLEGHREALGKTHQEALAPALVHGQQAAYSIFTSGSTGQPKGVVVSHRALSNVVHESLRLFPLASGDRVPQFAALSFDVAVAEILPALLQGATLVLAPDSALNDSARFNQLISRHRLVGFEIPTHFWNEWVHDMARADARPPASLRYVMIGTERVPSERLEQWRTRCTAPGPQLVHVYGLTETAITSVVYPFAADAVPAGYNLPIGRALANSSCHVLDSEMNPVPVGAPGEIYVGGHGLARGYLRRPALTAERFLPNPWSDRPGGRLVRTGDLAHHLADGRLVFLGRRDQQVKIRGYRIELAEIEAALARHPDLAETVVALRQDLPGEKRLVAYLVAAEGTLPSTTALHHFLKERLPEFMIPAAFVAIPKVPTTRHGKVDRTALPAPDAGRPVLEVAYSSPQSAVERTIAEVWREVLHLDEVGVHDNFFELGGNSMSLIRVHRRLRQLGEDVALMDLFTAPTIHTLASHCRQGPARTRPAGPQVSAEDRRMSKPESRSKDVAIIGLAGRFSGTADLDEFWQAVREGRETTRFFSDEELLQADIPQETLDDPTFIKAKGVLEGVELFDAAFFGITPREAEIIEPQQRVFIETSWHALENSGYDPGQFGGRIGVYAGRSPNYYFTENLLHNPRLEAIDSLKVDFGNFSDFIASKVSYLFDLDGPSINVQSSCSTSLSAVTQAYHSLLGGQCDLALAGGVSILFPHISGYFYREGGILSPDGRCRAFDEEACGMLIGEGVGALVLKRLDEAQRDGDQIHAVIRGAAVTNDGSGKEGFTAPGVEGQFQAIRAALDMAEVSAADLGFIEAHGTGTKLGDPTELAALTRAFRLDTDKIGFCGLGSVKPNIGHTDSASGIAGLLTAVRALQEKTFHPTLHFERPNPALRLGESPFFVAKEAMPWESNGRPRLAGVSSFGVGGANAHVVLEEAPEKKASGPSRPHQLVLVSARTASALETRSRELADHLRAHPHLPLADVAYTLGVGRKGFEHRRAVVCADADEAVRGLRGEDGRSVHSGHHQPGSRLLCFMFSGQGAQYPNMGLDLYRSENVFRQHVDTSCEHLKPHLGMDLRDLLYPSAERLEWATEELNQTRFTQPALFIISHAMAQLWISWGISPQLMIGHSMGEYVAACLAGVMTLEEALVLVATRGRLTQSMTGGAMVTVSLPAEEVAPLLGPEISIGVINSAHNCVASGTLEAVEALEKTLDTLGADHRRLRISGAFHSVTMEPIRGAFTQAVGAVDLKPPRIPYISDLSGTWITAEQATDPTYWADQMIGTVLFAQGIAEVLTKPDLCLLEVGPGRTLATLTRQQIDRQNPPTLLTSIRHPREEQADTSFLMTTLGRLWLAGVEIDWHRFYGEEERHRIALPVYPFERQRFWIERSPAATTAPEETLHKDPDLSRWFYSPSWKRLPATQAPAGAGEDAAEEATSWLIFLDPTGLGRRLASALKRRGHDVVTVRSGPGFSELDDRQYVIHPGRWEDYEALFEELSEQEPVPHRILHLWNVTKAEETPHRERFENHLEKGLYSLLLLIKTIDRLQTEDDPRLTVVTSGAQDVTGEENLQAEKSTVQGICRVLPQEHPHITCHSIDVELHRPKSAQEKALLELLISEALAPTVETAVALRGGYRWVETFEPVRLEENLEDETSFKERGVYFFTGGQGYLGFELGALLARKYQARLALVGRADLPAREDWDDWLERHAEDDDKTSWKIRQLRRLEEEGAEVLLLTADAADHAQMEVALNKTLEHFGALDGVLHAAGITDESHYFPIKATTPENCRAHFAPKIEGLFVLEDLLRERQVDFCLVFSSIASILGGLGFVTYTAANAVLDRRVERLNRDSPSHWVAVNWDGWLTTEELIAAAREAEPDSLLALAMTMEEGLRVTERILARPDLGQVAISTGSLELRIDRWVRLRSLLEGSTDETTVMESRYSRPELSNAYQEPRNEIEVQVAEIWQELLGVDQVGIHDNFFELGGDSLLAVHLSSKLLKKLGVEVSGGSLLSAQTVAEQAVAIVQQMATEVDDDMLAEILVK